VTDDNLDARRGIDVKADKLRRQQGEDGVRDTGDKDRVNGDRAEGLTNDQGEDEVRDAGDIDMVDGDTENRPGNGDKMDEDEDRNAAGKGQVDGDGVIGAKSADNDKDMDSDQTIPGRRATVDGDGQIVENDFESEEGMHDAADAAVRDRDADIDAGMDIDKAEKLPRSSRTKNTLGTQPSMSSSTYTKPRRKKNPASAYQGPSSQKVIDDRPHLFDSEQRSPIGESLRILKVCIAPCYFLFI
jgi:hypothetical protein